MRVALIFAAVALWLACFAATMLTIMPLSAMGMAAIFDGSFTFVERLQGAGFMILGLLAVVVLLVILTRISRLFAKAHHAPNQ